MIHDLNPGVLIDRLSKRFGSTDAVRALTLTIGRGEVFGLLGPSAAGKTTTLELLAGRLDPTAGRGTVDGFDLHRDRARIRQRVGYLPVTELIDVDLSVEANIDVMMALTDPAVLLLDDPGAAVGPADRESLWTCIRSLASRGKTIVLTSPAIEDAEVCDRVALMSRGSVVALGTPAELISAKQTTASAVARARANAAHSLRPDLSPRTWSLDHAFVS